VPDAAADLAAATNRVTRVWTIGGYGQRFLLELVGERPADEAEEADNPMRGVSVPGVGVTDLGNRVRLVVSDGFDPATGRRRQFSRVVHKGTKTQIRMTAVAFLAEVRRGEVAQPGEGTLGEYLEGDWLPSVSNLAKTGKPLAPTTAETYRYEVQRITRYVGAVPLARLGVRHVERLRDSLLNEGRCSPGTINETLKHLHRALERARKRGLIPRNPADPELVTRLAAGDEEETRDPITPDVALALLAKAAETATFEAEAALGLHSLRREEVLGLRWADIDPDYAGLWVRQTVTCAARALHLGPPKSKKSRRWIPLLPFAGEVLKWRRAEQAERRLRLGELWEDNDLVVDRGDGRPVNPSTFSTAWRTWRQRNGFSHVGGFHQLRRACSSLMRAAGVDPKVISETLGHTDTRFTEQVYTDVWAERKREALQRLGALVGLQE
jgi:integrase